MQKNEGMPVVRTSTPVAEDERSTTNSLSAAGIFAAIGTPAHPPKPRGKSSGWKAGKTRQRRIPYPIVKKRTPKSRNRTPKSA